MQSKAKAKSANLKYQWQIMRTLGLDDKEIARFADPLHWFGYFPGWAIKDLKGMGLRVSFSQDGMVQLDRWLERNTETRSSYEMSIHHLFC